MRLTRADYSVWPIAGIIRCMPIGYHASDELDRRFMDFCNKGGSFQWALSARPKIEVLYLYLVVGGVLRYRANIVGFAGAGGRRILNGGEYTAREWVIVTGPVVKPPQPIEIKGFQGFRYSRELW